MQSAVAARAPLRDGAEMMMGCSLKADEANLPLRKFVLCLRGGPRFCNK